MMQRVQEVMPTRVGTARAAHRTTHVLVPILVFVTGAPLGWFVLQTRGHDYCSYLKDYLPDQWLFAFGAVMFFAGHWIASIGPPHTLPATGAPQQRITRLVMVSAFLVLALVWFFEALGTAEISVASGGSAAQLEPITYYIRCTIYRDFASLSGGPLTWYVVGLAFFVAGQWFWGDRSPSAPASRDEWTER